MACDQRSEKSKVLETLGFKRKKNKRILLLGGAQGIFGDDL